MGEKVIGTGTYKYNVYKDREVIHEKVDTNMICALFHLTPRQIRYKVDNCDSDIFFIDGYRIEVFGKREKMKEPKYWPDLAIEWDRVRLKLNPNAKRGESL